MTPQPLFVEDIYQALDALVMGCGGYKSVGSQLWPSLPVDRAGRDLADCLNPANARKLDGFEYIALLKLGRKHDVHTAIAYINETAGYAKPEPIDPETEKQRLQREFINATAELSRLGSMISRLSS